MMECQSAYCLKKSRHRHPAWSIDGKPYCNPCFEEWLESHFVDEHRVHRISEEEQDFEHNWRPKRRNTHKIMAVKK